MNDFSTPESPVDILLIGNVTRELIDEHDFEHYRLGGTVTFAAVVAEHLGRRPTVLTRAAPETDLSGMPPNTQRTCCPRPPRPPLPISTRPTARPILLHTRTADQRRRYGCRAACTIVLLGPIANEIDGDVPAVFADSTVIAAVPQGWMRRLDACGRVHSKQWESAAQILPHLDAADPLVGGHRL